MLRAQPDGTTDASRHSHENTARPEPVEGRAWGPATFASWFDKLARRGFHGFGAGRRPMTPQHDSPTLTVSAFAKINLTLEVLGRRDDGLHEVATVLQTIDLADGLRFRHAEAMSLRCRGMPRTPDNLIIRAANLLRDAIGVSAGAWIHCAKRIPLAAGLGGGSADAAATLRGLNQLWGVGLDEERLLELASLLGADVPYALRGGTALATGNGRTLKWLPDAPRHWVVLVPLHGDDPAKTAEMYRRLLPRDMTDGTLARRQAVAITAGAVDYGCVRSAFLRAAEDRWPEVSRALDALLVAAACAATLSGAGPSVVGLYRTRAAALEGMKAVRAEGLPARLCRFVVPADARPSAACRRNLLVAGAGPQQCQTNSDEPDRP